MNSKRCAFTNEGIVKRIVKAEDITWKMKLQHMHRRTISKTSEELLESLKMPNQRIIVEDRIVTAQLVRNQLAKKGLAVLREETFEESTGNISDDEITIRNIIEQRKALLPLTYINPEKTSIKSIKNIDDKIAYFGPGSISTSTTTLTSNEDSNMDRVLNVLETCFLPGNEHKSARKSIFDLMQKSPEPHYALVLNDWKKLMGIFTWNQLQDISTALLVMMIYLLSSLQGELKNIFCMIQSKKHLQSRHQVNSMP